MTSRSFKVPEEFRAFMREVVQILAERGSALDADDALQSACGYGGRIDGRDTFQFVYFEEAHKDRWTISLREEEILEIASGRMIDVEANFQGHPLPQRCPPSGEAVLLWGQDGRDALAISSACELLSALDALHRRAMTHPTGFQIWSRCDDLLHAVVFQEECALQVVWSDGGRASSRRESGALEARLQIRWADSVPWSKARAAAIEFVHTGEIGDLITDPSADPELALLAAQGRSRALSRVGEIPRRLASTSLLAPKESGPALEEGDEDLAWARRLVAALKAAKLIELEDEGEVERGVARLLWERGDEAIAAHEEAEELAEAITVLPGVGELFVTADELRSALRATSSVPAP